MKRGSQGVFVNIIRLKKVRLAQARCDTIRLKLLKIVAVVQVTDRGVWFSLADGYLYQVVFA